MLIWYDYVIKIPQIIQHMDFSCKFKKHFGIITTKNTSDQRLIVLSRSVINMIPEIFHSDFYLLCDKNCDKTSQKVQKRSF